MIDAYLERIGYAGPRTPTLETLIQLHRAHLLSVPFENLDIALGRRIEPSIDAFFDKIVRDRRGGFCYELNGLFAWLLGRLGFAATMLSARVWNGDRPGPEFDHMALLVELDRGRVLADVGFGDSFLEPLPLGEPGPGIHQGTTYRVSGAHPELVLERRKQGGEWERQYIFSLTSRHLSEFAAMCAYHQTSPASHFTRNSVCSIATPSGRVTISGRRAITTSGAGRDERAIADAEQYRELLANWFGIDLGDRTLVQRLLDRPT
jgi:N-hydroxyarylamine O-acetyltransferase